MCTRWISICFFPRIINIKIKIINITQLLAALLDNKLQVSPLMIALSERYARKIWIDSRLFFETGMKGNQLKKNPINVIQQRDCPYIFCFEGPL